MKNGFTLVELSIVLVIIGLLIGGILVGQSLISSTVVQSQIREIQQYDAMIGVFKNKFKTIPGDSDLFTPAGDKDGYIDAVLPGTTPPAGGLALFAAEVAGFWKHLSDAGMTKTAYTNVLGGSGSVTGVNFPKAIYGHNTNYIPGYVAAMTGRNKNILMINNFNYNSAGNMSTVSYEILAPDALAIDQKIDDANALSGNIYSFGTVCRDAGGLYYANNSAAKCGIFVGIGTQVAN